MKPKNRPAFRNSALVFCSAVLWIPSTATAQSLYWAAPVNESGNRDGVWNPVTIDWSHAPGGAADTAWSNNTSSTANFTRPEGGTVTLATQIFVGNLNTSTSSPLTLSGGALRMSGISTITVNGAPLSIQSTIINPLGALLKQGNGLLEISGQSSVRNLSINQGQLSLSGNNLLDSTAVTNSSVLIMNGNDTITRYTQVSGVLGGGAQLTTTSDALIYSGAIAGSLSGKTTILGNTTVSGSLGGGLLTVQAGTLTLTGSSTNQVVQISAQALLVDSNGGLNGGEQNVTNSGTLRLDANDTIHDYDQAPGGELAGAGTLFVDKAAFLEGGTVSGNLSGPVICNGNVLVSGSIGGSDLAVQSGTLTLTGSSTTNKIDISAGALFVDSNGGLNGTEPAIRNSGTLQLDADDTIHTYTQLAGLLSGSGTLTVNKGATLQAGSVTGKLTASVFVTGDVSVSGSIGGTTLTLQKGTLNLTGVSTHSSVSILKGTTLLDVNSGLNGPTATLTNSGTLNLTANDTIYTYNQGIGAELSGPGTLTAGKAAFLNGGTVSGNLSGGIITNGDVLVSGNIGGSLWVQSGTLGLTGTSSAVPIKITGGILDVSNGALSPDSVVTNAATFVVNADDTISQLIQNQGHQSGGGVLAATNGITLNGGTIEGKVSGNLTVNGDSMIVGQTGGGSLSVHGGSLLLTGTSTHQTIAISNHGSLTDSYGGLDSASAVTNAGTLTVHADDTVASYVQNGGTLAGSGKLTVAGHSTLHGLISGYFSGNANVDGDLQVTGTIGGGNLTIGPNAQLGLAGKSTNAHVNIAASAVLWDSTTSDGLADDAVVVNEGMLTMESDDTISTYTQKVTGILTSPMSGTLTVTNGVTLEGGRVEGNLRGDTTITGNVILRNGSFGGGTLSVASGSLALAGNSDNLVVDISQGTTLDDFGRLNDEAAVTNAGTLVVHLEDTIGTYIQQESGLLAGEETLIASSGATLNGGSISGSLAGNTRILGNVRVSGRLGGGTLDIATGTLDLTGSSTHGLVNIASNAALDDTGDLGDTAAIINAGAFTVGNDDTIGSLTNNGGSVGGDGRLTVSGPSVFNGGVLSGSLTGRSGIALNGGTSITGLLTGNTTTHGDVLISGVLNGGNLHVAEGTLTLSGNANGFVSVANGAALRGTGKINGDLSNHGALATDGSGNGALTVSGGLATDGLVSLSLKNATDHDRITIGSLAALGGSLIVTNLGSGLEAGEIATLIDAQAFTGGFDNFTTLGFDNGVLFDDATGKLIGLAGGSTGSSNRYLNLNSSQTQVYLSLYEDSVEIGSQNVTTGDETPSKRSRRSAPAASADGSIGFTSGLSDGDAQLVQALNQATFTRPGTIYQPVVNRLSPEVHRGMADYTEQAVRSHVQEALESAPVSRSGKTQVFATAHSSVEGVDSTVTDAGYDLQMAGFTTGVRFDIDRRFQIGGLLGADDGSIQGGLIDTDARGITTGIFGSYLIEEKHATILTASLTRGAYNFDSRRESFGGEVEARDIGSSAIELAIGVRAVAYEKDGLRITPNASLRYLDGGVDGFTESGAGVPLMVRSQDIESVLLDLGVDLEYQLPGRVTLTGNIGYVTDFHDSPETVNASFAASGTLGRKFGVSAPGIDEEAVVLGVGAYHDINETMRINVGYRGDIRFDSQDSHSFGIGASFGF